MTRSTTEVTNLFYTVARGWISQTNPSVGIQFERTHPFSNLGSGIVSSIRRKLDDDTFAIGQRQLVLISDKYRVTPAASGPDKLTAHEITQITYMATNHFFSALGQAFALEQLFFLEFVDAVSLRMQNYYNAEIIAARPKGPTLNG